MLLLMCCCVVALVYRDQSELSGFNLNGGNYSLLGVSSNV